MVLIRRFNCEGKTMVMVTHNPEKIAYADQAIYLRNGLIIEERAASVTTRSAA